MSVLAEQRGAARAHPDLLPGDAQGEAVALRHRDGPAAPCPLRPRSPGGAVGGRIEDEGAAVAEQVERAAAVAAPDGGAEDRAGAVQGADVLVVADIAVERAGCAGAAGGGSELQAGLEAVALQLQLPARAVRLQVDRAQVADRRGQPFYRSALLERHMPRMPFERLEIGLQQQQPRVDLLLQQPAVRARQPRHHPGEAGGADQPPGLPHRVPRRQQEQRGPDREDQQGADGAAPHPGGAPGGDPGVPGGGVPGGNTPGEGRGAPSFRGRKIGVQVRVPPQPRASPSSAAGCRSGDH